MTCGTEGDINIAMFYEVSDTWYRRKHQHS